MRARWGCLGSVCHYPEILKPNYWRYRLSSIRRPRQPAPALSIQRLQAPRGFWGGRPRKEFFGMARDSIVNVGPMRVWEYECACCAFEDRLGDRKVCTGRDCLDKCDNCRHHHKGHICTMVCLFLPTGSLPPLLTSNRWGGILNPSEFFSWKCSHLMTLGRLAAAGERIQ